MKHPTPTAARVLVASNDQGDAQQILRQLETDFEHVQTSTDPDRAVQDFEHYRPDVLVLAFDSLEKAQLYYLGLYRLGCDLHPHRTVILCHKDEVRAVFELCKKAYFDDYVLYWPHAHDGQRLAMSVWTACRDVKALQAKALPNAAEKMPSGARPVVMVVEDDEFARKLIGRALDPQVYEIVFANDSVSALGQLRRVQPAVILMDIRLPGLDGLSLTRQLKASPRLAAIPVLMMTGDARRETLLSSMEAGAAGFVVKPFTRESLQVNLEKILPR
jgi:CheY-like chemotaxis protein